MQNHQNRRRKYFIDSRVQGKIIGLAIALILFIAAAGILPMLLLGAGPEDSEEARKISQLFANIIIILIAIVVVAMFATIAYGVRLTHRIVGPIYAFSRHFGWLKEGIYSRDLKLRQKDEFKSLANVFNIMQAALRHRTQQTVETCNKVEVNLDELSQLLSEPEFDQERAREMLQGLKEDLSGLREENQKYIAQS